MVEDDVIRMNYSIYPNGREELISIYFNNRGGVIPDEKSKAKDMLERLPLTRLDRMILGKRPLLAVLSVGRFKLVSDIAENINNDTAGHYIKYERVSYK